MKGAGKSVLARSKRNAMVGISGIAEPATGVIENPDSASFAEKNFLLVLNGKNSVATIAEKYTVATYGGSETER
jgi:hypothetical protein